MKKTFIAFVLLFVMAAPSFAQIEEEIAQSKTEKISKGRDFLLEKFLDRDYDKVKEIKDYLLSLEDENYSAFAPTELWKILFWTGEYDELIENIRQFDSIQLNSIKERIYPRNDLMSWKLSPQIIEDEHLIRFGIQEAQLPAEDFDFLNLYLDWDLEPYSDDNQKEWNRKADKFLAEYPNGNYEWFVRHLIRVVFEEDGWIWGFSVGFGSGVFTEDLNDWMSGELAGCLAIESSYKRFRLSFYFDGLDIKLKENHSKDGDGSTTAFNLSVGYDLVGWNRIDLTPFVAVGVGRIGSKTIDSIPELAELLKWRMNYEAGVDLDFRFSEYIKTGHLPGFVRLRYWYDMPSFGKFGPNLSGGSHCFLIGIGLSMGKDKRVY